MDIELVNQDYNPQTWKLEERIERMPNYESQRRPGDVKSKFSWQTKRDMDVRT